jgi:4-hydroxybenzoate polyprenyltransferase
MIAMTSFAKADSASDIPREGWVGRLPGRLAAFARLARLDRPIGTWLLLFPCWWGTTLAWAGDPAAGRWPDIGLFLLFAMGAVVMRGAGCTVNDIVDRKFDARVARTALRPIPSGAVSVREALLFLAAQMLLGAAVLVCLNGTAIPVGLASLPLIVAYPFMKRITYWPQAFLGLTFNWGALVGWAAVSGGLGLPALALYAAGIAWTLGYDTIYAHQDKEDDALIGVKSTALLFGARTRPWIAGFYVLALALFGLAGALAGLAWPFWIGLATVAAQLAWQTVRVDPDDPADCLAKFKSNRWTGWALLAGMLAAGALARA